MQVLQEGRANGRSQQVTGAQRMVVLRRQKRALEKGGGLGQLRRVPGYGLLQG